MRTVLFFLFMIAMNFLNGQSNGLQFIENDHQVIMGPRSNPRLIGMLGKNILMMDIIPQGTNLTVYDSSFHIIKQSKQLLSFYQANKLILQDSLHVTWSEYHTDEEWLCRQTFDYEANASPIQKVVMENSEHRFVNMVTDKKHQFYFFYTVNIKDSPNVVLKGLILDAKWNKLKEVSGIFQLSTSQERAPVPIIDAAGNIQVLVYDKLSNFRLSAGMTINTLLSHENNFRKESFEFDKIKLYDPSISEDVEMKQLVLTDFFYDGHTKEKKGLITVRIPYERGSELIPVFQDIPDSIKIEIRANTKNLRTKQSVLESIITTDTYEEDGTKLIMTDLLDLPIHQLVRDAEVEPEFRSRSRSRYRNDRPVFMGGSNRFSSGIINGNSSIPVPDPNRISGNPNARIPVIGNSSTRPGTAATSRVASGATPFPNPLPPPPLVTAETKIFLPPKEKRAVFLVDDKGMIKWYRYLSESFESYQFSMFTPVNYMIRDQDEWQFLHYDESIILDPINKIEPTDYNLIRFSLLGISEKGIRTQSVQTVCLVGTRFFKPMLWKKGIYVMPFINNARSISGLAVLDMDPKKLKD